MEFNFDIGDGSNMRYVQCIISAVVIDIEANQSLEDGVDKRLYGGVNGMWWWYYMMDYCLLETVGERFTNSG